MAEEEGTTLPCQMIEPGQKELTPDQRQYARQFVDQPIAAMFALEVDEQAAAEHLRQAYQVAGLQPPLILWFDSPITFNQALFSRSESTDAEKQRGRDVLCDIMMNAMTRRLARRLGDKTSILPKPTPSWTLRFWVKFVQVAGELGILYGGLIAISDWWPRAWHWPWWEWPWRIQMSIIMTGIMVLAWGWDRALKRLKR